MTRSTPAAEPTVATFSIVARDPATGDLGVAVQSKFPAVGAVVPWARAGVGAVATQAFANPTYGPRGLDLLGAGLTPSEVVEVLTRADEGKAERQVGVVDAVGRAASYTGPECFEWAGHITGEGFAVQGNILAGEAVVAEMARAYRRSEQMSFPERLISALEAGQQAGGDRRGMQSAALLVVREKGGYAGMSDVWIDLRVDDHDAPIAELRRLYGVHQLYLGVSDPEDYIEIDAELAAELEAILIRQGHEVPADGRWSEADDEAFEAMLGVLNLEMRHRPGGLVDPVVLRYLREHTERD